MRDWIGATPLRMAVLSAVVGGAVFLVLSLLVFGPTSGAALFSAVWTAAMFAWSLRSWHKGFPGDPSAWSSLDAAGKQAVARALRTGEPPTDRQVAAAVVERVQAVRLQGKAGPRLDALEQQAAAIVHDDHA